MHHSLGSILPSALLLAAVGCRSNAARGEAPASPREANLATDAAADRPETPFARSGFRTEIEDGRLWVLADGQEKGEKHVTLVGAGPCGMTLKAVDRDTALRYLGCKPGFAVRIEEGRVWVLRPGESPTEKRVTLLGEGPLGSTLMASDYATALAYLGQRPGFEVSVENGRLWVLRPGQAKSEKHVTAVGGGPLGATVRALDRDTLLAWQATRPGFVAEIEDGRVWILRPGEEKSEKCVMRIGAGPDGATLKARDLATLDAWVATNP